MDNQPQHNWSDSFTAVEAAARRALGWTWRRRWRLAAVVVVVAALGLVTACALQRRVVYPGQVRRDAEPRWPIGAEVWWLEHDQGRTQAVFLPATGTEAAGASRTTPAVVFAHGNGSLIDDWLGPMQRYRDAGVAVLLVEFRGYTRSDGTPSETHIVEDFVAGYDRLVALPEIDPGRVVFHGQSIGGGVMGAVARQREPAALILQSTFTRLPAVAARFGVPESWVKDKYDTLGLLAGYGGPVLIMHGRADRVIPYAMAEENFAAVTASPAFADSRLVLFDSGHDAFTPEGWWPAIQGLLGRTVLKEGA